jgi:hypothetical protein
MPAPQVGKGCASEDGCRPGQGLGAWSLREIPGATRFYRPDLSQIDQREGRFKNLQATTQSKLKIGC